MNQSGIIFALFFLVLLLLQGCVIQKENRSISSKVYNSDGLINFNIIMKSKPLEKLTKDLAKGPIDTCVVFYHMTFFRDYSISYDSVTYECFNASVLSKKALKRFERQFKPKVYDDGNAMIGYEPYKAVFRLTVEVGAQKDLQHNRYLIGYSRRGIVSAPQ